jgi:hypothetical protein
MQAATTSMATANWRERAGFGTGEADHLLHDAQNQIGACSDGEFLEKAIQMRVNGVFRDFEPPGNPPLREIVKDALDNLQFAFCQAQRASNLKPSKIAEH